MAKVYAQSFKDKIIELRKQGHSYEQILEKLNCGIDLIRSTCRKAGLGRVKLKPPDYKKEAGETYDYQNISDRGKAKLKEFYSDKNIITTHIRSNYLRNKICRTYVAVPKLKSKRGAR